MAIYYIDLYNGDDANDGTSWATAWKTVTGGCTAARLSAGDEVRISKTPDHQSIGLCTWTNGQHQISLPEEKVALVTDCEDIWNASVNVTCAKSTTKLVGAYCSMITVNSAFTTGKAAYFNLGTPLDLSAFQNLSFHFKTSLSGIAEAALSVCLCSDDYGDTVVDQFVITAKQYSANSWRPITLSKTGGGNLGSSIRSIALYVLNDYSTSSVIYYFDHILATKSDGVDLSSCVTKDSDWDPESTDGLFMVQSIFGTTLTLGVQTSVISSAAGIPYHGLSETVETFILKGFATEQVSSTTANVSYPTCHGDPGNEIQIKGGYEPGTDLQNGATLFDGVCCYGYGFRSLTTTVWSIKIDKLNFIRYSTGLYVMGSPKKMYFTGVKYLCFNGSTGLAVSGIGSEIGPIGAIIGNAYYGISISSESDSHVLESIALIAYKSNIGITVAGSNNIFKRVKSIWKCYQQGISVGNSTGVQDNNQFLSIEDIKGSDTIVYLSNAGVRNKFVLKDYTISKNGVTTATSGEVEFIDLSGKDLALRNYGCVVNVKSLCDVSYSSFYPSSISRMNLICPTFVGQKYWWGRVFKDQTSYPEGYTSSQRFEFNYLCQSRGFFFIKIAEVAVKANKLVTASCLCMKKYNTSTPGYFGDVGIAIQTDEYYGIEETYTYFDDAYLETWQVIQFQFTPPADMVIPIFVKTNVFWSASSTIFFNVADLIVNQAD